MFSIKQKRDIANQVQQILRDTGHPELPIGEIQFKLYVHGRYCWSWAGICNNAAVPIPSINPWNEAQDQNIPAEDRYGREPDNKGKDVFVSGLGCVHVVPDKVKPLAQYLGEYIEHEIETENILSLDDFEGLSLYNSWRELLEQAFDAYESTEQVKIRIEKVL